MSRKTNKHEQIDFFEEIMKTCNQFLYNDKTKTMIIKTNKPLSEMNDEEKIKYMMYKLAFTREESEIFIMNKQKMGIFTMLTKDGVKYIIDEE